MFFQEKKQMMICVAGVLTVGGFMLVRYLPLQRMIDRIESKRQVAQTAIAEVTMKRQRFPQSQERLEELRERVQKFDLNVPLNRDLGGFLQQMATLMDDHELTEQQIQPGTAIAMKELNCIPISMRCKGGLTQIFEFFKSLRSLDRALRIGQVMLTNDTDFSGQVSMQTEATIFYRTKAKKG